MSSHKIDEQIKQLLVDSGVSRIYVLDNGLTFGKKFNELIKMINPNDYYKNMDIIRAIRNKYSANLSQFMTDPVLTFDEYKQLIERHDDFLWINRDMFLRNPNCTLDNVKTMINTGLINKNDLSNFLSNQNCSYSDIDELVRMGLDTYYVYSFLFNPGCTFENVKCLLDVYKLDAENLRYFANHPNCLLEHVKQFIAMNVPRSVYYAWLSNSNCSFDDALWLINEVQLDTKLTENFVCNPNCTIEHVNQLVDIGLNINYVVDFMLNQNCSLDDVKQLVKLGLNTSDVVNFLSNQNCSLDDVKQLVKHGMSKHNIRLFLSNPNCTLDDVKLLRGVGLEVKDLDSFLFNQNCSLNDVKELIRMGINKDKIITYMNNRNFNLIL